jgi:glucosamine kinase
MPLFLAIDAGGTKTDYVLADSSEIVATARTESIKTLRVDGGTAKKRLEWGLSHLRAQSGESLANIAVTCVGAAGSQVPSVNSWLSAEIKSLVGGRLILVEDVEIALDAAFKADEGVLVLAGTGSNVAGRRSDGSLVVHGGWGPALADYASGHTLSQTALRESFIAFDEGHTSLFLQRVLQHWKINEIADLVDYANRATGRSFAELAPILSECAVANDEVSLRAIEAETAVLARIATIAVNEVFGEMMPQRSPRIALAGSIMEHFTVVRESIQNNIRRLVPDVTFNPHIASPIDGALYRARNSFEVETQKEHSAAHDIKSSTVAL